LREISKKQLSFAEKLFAPLICSTKMNTTG